MNRSIKELEEALSKPLPGLLSQLRMAPVNRDSELFSAEGKLHSAVLSAVMILLFHIADKLHVVFIQRSIYDGYHSGQIAFPGGKFETKDASYLAAAVRETYEEIGVDSQLIEIIGELSDLYIPPSNYLVKVFVGYCNAEPHFTLDYKEVQSVIVVDIDDLINKENIKSKDFFANSIHQTVNAPFYHVNGVDIWGATAMIVSEFIDAIKCAFILRAIILPRSTGTAFPIIFATFPCEFE